MISSVLYLHPNSTGGPDVMDGLQPGTTSYSRTCTFRNLTDGVLDLFGEDAGEQGDADADFDADFDACAASSSSCRSISDDDGDGSHLSRLSRRVRTVMIPFTEDDVHVLWVGTHAHADDGVKHFKQDTSQSQLPAEESSSVLSSSSSKEVGRGGACFHARCWSSLLLTFVALWYAGGMCMIDKLDRILVTRYSLLVITVICALFERMRPARIGWSESSESAPPYSRNSLDLHSVPSCGAISDEVFL